MNLPKKRLFDDDPNPDENWTEIGGRRIFRRMKIVS
jgi:hypothetical protein